MMSDEEKWDLLWYALIFAMFIFLVMTNYRLTKTQTQITNLDKKVDGLAVYHYKLITAVASSQNKSIDYQQDFEGKVWDSINVLQQLNADWWLKKHNLDEEIINKQMDIIAANCTLRIINNNYIQHWTDDVISFQVNSSKGEIIVDYFSDGTIKCKKDLFDKDISCQELCSGGTSTKA